VTATVRVVGLGPGDAGQVTRATWELLTHAPLVRLRTRVHPAAVDLDLESYDAWYEASSSFEVLYQRIVDDLVRLAQSSPNGEVVYVVPGSPVVAEQTVVLLRGRSDVDVICEPAVSVIDVACAALGIDPMAQGLRVVDALESTEAFRGPGPLLILQTYAPEVLATVADRLPRACEVVILHHLGLADQQLIVTSSDELTSFAADHLTSLYVAGLRGAGEATEDLVSFMRRLRAECPWDQEQTHESLTRHLVEEAYEALDALSALAAMVSANEEDELVVAHAEEELGDLLFQIIFHAELADEEGRFTFATVADGVRDKLTGRHPHIFGDVVVNSASDVEANWEVLKQREKGRSSVLDGVAWHLPALALFAKVQKKAERLGLSVENASDDLTAALVALAQRGLDEDVDLEAALRAHVLAVAQRIRAIEETAKTP